MSRQAALVAAGKDCMPIMGAAMVLFFLAGIIEGFVSPSGYLPYVLKAAVAILSSGMLMFYFLVLGFPRRRHAV